MPSFAHTTRRWLVAAVCCFALGGALYGFLFWQLKVKNERISERQNELLAQAKQESSLAAKRSLAQDTAGMREGLSALLVRRDQAVAFIESLEALGAKSGTTAAIKAVEAGKVESGTASVEELRTVLEAKGAWQNVLRFLALLELLPYASRLEQVSLSHPSAEAARAGAAEWRGQFIIRVLKEK